jgi:hypothetical protein
MRVLILTVGFFAISWMAEAQNLFFRTYGALGHFNQAADILVGQDNGFLIAGSTGGWGSENGDMVVIRTDSLGIQEWFKVYGTSYSEKAVDLIALNDGNYLIAGTTNRSLNSDYDLYLVKFDANGDTLWTKQFGTTAWDLMEGITELSNGNVIMTSTSYEAPFPNGGILNICIDASGTELWRGVLPMGDQQLSGGIVATTEDTIYVGGSAFNPDNSSMDFLLAKLDANGTVIWTKLVGTTEEDHLTDVCLGSGALIGACGYTMQTETAKQGKLYQFDAAGNVPFFAQTTPGAQFANSFSAIRFSANDNTMIVASVFKDGTVDRAALFRYTTDFQFLCSFVFPGIQNSEATAVLGVDDGNILCGTDLEFSPGQTSIFVNRAAFDCATVNLEVGIKNKLENEIMVDVFPNPSNGQFSFVTPVQFDRIEIFDITGRVVKYEMNTVSGTSTIELQNQSAGIYIMSMFGTNGQILSTRKLVIE